MLKAPANVKINTGRRRSHREWNRLTMPSLPFQAICLIQLPGTFCPRMPRLSDERGEHGFFATRFFLQSEYLMALRRRAEALAITRLVDNEITTRSLYAHYSLKDIEFLEEKAKEAERGGKGHG